jgi:hypothetical protein
MPSSLPESIKPYDEPITQSQTLSSFSSTNHGESSVNLRSSLTFSSLPPSSNEPDEISDFVDLPPNTSSSYLEALDVLKPKDQSSIECGWEDIDKQSSISLPREWKEWQKYECSRLIVEIFSAKELKSSYPNGTLDPYVLVSFRKFFSSVSFSIFILLDFPF